MKTALFFDTETTDKWDFKAGPLASHQPNIVQLAMKLVREDGKVLNTTAMLISPVNYSRIAEEAANIHGITLGEASNFGFKPETAMRTFTYLAGRADVLVCHNYDFDSRMVKRELELCDLRSGLLFEANRKQFCTMKATTGLCQLPGARGGYKWPKLIELHRHLFGTDFSGAHDALEDVNATVRCFFELVKRGEISWTQF